MADGHQDFARGLSEAVGFGALGRAAYYALGGQRPGAMLLWLWELPAAAALGVMGKGLAAWLELSKWPELGLIVLCAVAGVRAVDGFIDRVLGKRK